MIIYCYSELHQQEIFLLWACRISYLCISDVKFYQYLKYLWKLCPLHMWHIDQLNHCNLNKHFLWYNHNLLLIILYLLIFFKIKGDNIKKKRRMYTDVRFFYQIEFVYFLKITCLASGGLKHLKSCTVSLSISKCK